MSIEIRIDKIDNNVKQISSIVDLDLKQETKETLNELANKIGTISFEGMNSPGDHIIPRLFYGTEDIMVLQQEVDYNYTEYENVKEILDYWRQLYKDPQFSVQERNEIIEKIRTTYLEYENLLTHFNYETTLFVFDDEEDNQSSNSTHTANIVSESEKESDSDNEEEEETTPSRKRKLDEPLDPQEFGTWGTSEFNNENINTGEDKPSSSGIKEENTFFPTPSYQRRDELHKQPIAQNGTYLDLTNIHFKDQKKKSYR
jgi:hypothetical protein